MHEERLVTSTHHIVTCYIALLCTFVLVLHYFPTPSPGVVLTFVGLLAVLTGVVLYDTVVTFRRPAQYVEVQGNAYGWTLRLHAGAVLTTLVSLFLPFGSTAHTTLILMTLFLCVAYVINYFYSQPSVA